MGENTENDSYLTREQVAQMLPKGKRNPKLVQEIAARYNQIGAQMFQDQLSRLQPKETPEQARNWVKSMVAEMAAHEQAQLAGQLGGKARAR